MGSRFGTAIDLFSFEFVIKIPEISLKIFRFDGLPDGDGLK